MSDTAPPRTRAETDTMADEFDFKALPHELRSVLSDLLKGVQRMDRGDERFRRDSASAARRWPASRRRPAYAQTPSRPSKTKKAVKTTSA